MKEWTNALIIEDVRIAQQYMTTHEVTPWRQADDPTTTTPSLTTRLEVSTANRYEIGFPKLPHEASLSLSETAIPPQSQLCQS